MIESLLVNVSKYASSDKNSPIENFITEAFAWLLRNDDEVRSVLAQFIREKGKETGRAQFEVDDSVSIETQINFDGVYPDMMWEPQNQEWQIIFEHKVWSELHDKQLTNYREYAEKKFSHFAIVLITAHAGQHRQSPDIALCWYEIADKLQGLACDNEKTQWIRQEFLALLNRNGLVNVTPINPLAISYYQEAKKLDKQLYDICNHSSQKSWSLVQSDIETFESPTLRSSRGRHDIWGRIGLEFATPTFGVASSEPWVPAVFCGFLIDGYDHDTYDLMESGPMAVLIISIDKVLHASFKQGGYYDQLVGELKQSVKNQPHWTVSDRSNGILNWNKWHPLIIHCDLYELFKNSHSVAEQEQQFFNQMNKIQSLLLQCNSFQPFCNELMSIIKDVSK